MDTHEEMGNLCDKLGDIHKPSTIWAQQWQG